MYPFDASPNHARRKTMAIFEIQGSNVPVKFWTQREGVEDTAYQQLLRTASLPWVAHHIAVMPDVHYGKGATVGSVVAMRGAVAPSSVGVDIGCGMGAVQTSLRASDLPDSLKDIRLAVERAIPVGNTSHEQPVYPQASQRVREASEALFERFSGLAPEVQPLKERAARQIGTLGSGNHFIELCLDTDDMVWLMLHSGSRHIGLQLANVHIAKAKTLPHNDGLPDRDLSVLLHGTSEMDAYLRDASWAQEYAALNRAVMLERYQDVLRQFFPNISFGRPILCHHNYVSRETHFGESLYVTRKGAIRAGSRELGIIPGSMGAKSFIVVGLGNPDSFMSASHGAGRRMSRSAASKRFSESDLASQTVGIECRKDKGVVDEIPGAYKDIDEVMSDQSDLVRPIVTLRQIMCIKG